MFHPYHKINALYKRYSKDKHTKEELPDGKKYGDFIDGNFACEEFEYLFNNKWIWSEKLDGTNICINIDSDISFHGRTERSQIPAPLVGWLMSWKNDYKKVAQDIFSINKEVRLYGEGVGAGIQRGGLFGQQHMETLLLRGMWASPLSGFQMGEAREFARR